MPHDTPLISILAIGFGLAFALGIFAQRMKMPPIVGYLLAGVIVGPFTPGYVADQNLATELAEIGVILLMFGVGLHFSLRDLLSVKAIAIPGAVGQIAVATLMGIGLAWALGWGMGAGLVFGLSLSVASTVVLLRALQERKVVETEKGRIAVGWLIVEDLAMVVALVLLPPLAGVLGGVTPVQGGLAMSLGIGPLWGTLAVTAVKVGLFVAVMLVMGRKVIPWVLHYVAHTGSRELFRLGVLAIALGVAYASAKLFGVSFALGAFFAGMVLAESKLATQAAKETLPLRDAFAVLFFVSVGMLFDPLILLREPLTVLAVVGIITLGKAAVAYAIVRAFGHGKEVALTIAASLAQIGEFSFILIVLGGSLSLVPPEAQDLVVAGAILSILVNPLGFKLVDRFVEREAEATPAPVTSPVTSPVAPPEAPPIESHVLVVGAGRVGGRIVERLSGRDGLRLRVVEEDAGRAEALRGQGVEVQVGEAAGLLGASEFAAAKVLILAIPEAFESGHLVEAARAANPAIRIVARAHSNEERTYLSGLGADVVVMGEDELAAAMVAAVPS
jgi:CPA2 family monovalent cation:H+ antiporter-2